MRPAAGGARRGPEAHAPGYEDIRRLPYRRCVVPSPALRLQHALLCVGSASFAVLVLNLFAAALAEARLLPDG